MEYLTVRSARMDDKNLQSEGLAVPYPFVPKSDAPLHLPSNYILRIMEEMKYPPFPPPENRPDHHLSPLPPHGAAPTPPAHPAPFSAPATSQEKP
jgi:hypothetical protein